MASIKVSELPQVTAISPADVLIINDEDLTTSKITLTNFTSSFTGQDLIFSGNVAFIAPTTFSANALPTFNADVVFNQNVTFNNTIVGVGNKIDLGELKDVTFPETIQDGYVVTWNAVDSKWNAEETGSMNKLLDDTTPQLGGNLDVNGYTIESLAVAGGPNGQDIKLNPNGAGKVTIMGNATGGSGKIVLNCENNSHGVIFSGPPHSAAASYTFILPNNMGTAGQVLSTNGTSATSWISITPQSINAATAAQGTTADNAMNINKNNQIPEFANDSAAAAGGVVVGGLYRIANAVQVRLA